MRSGTIGRLFLLALLPIRLTAQTAGLSGIISDPSGLAAPKAKVTVKGQATGLTREVSSNQEGLYAVRRFSSDADSSDRFLVGGRRDGGGDRLSGIQSFPLT